MARTQAQIYDQIEAAVVADSNLSDISGNTSKVAIWRLLAWIMAGAAYALELIFDAFKIEVDTLSQAAQVGNAAWYRSQVLGFQYGDSLSLINDKYVYAVDDDTKKIIKRCAIEERTDGSIRIKVAKVSGFFLTALTNDEVLALISYVKKIRFAGTKFQVFTNNGDILKVTISIFYDPIIILSTVKENVEAAVVAYIQNLPFNGELQLSKLTDQIQLIEGVNDVVITLAQSKFSLSDPYTTINRTTVAIGGYFNISTNAGETLNDTITYTAI